MNTHARESDRQMQRIVRGTQPLRGEHRRFDDGRINHAVRERGVRRVGRRECQQQPVRRAMDRSGNLIQGIHFKADRTTCIENRSLVSEQRRHAARQCGDIEHRRKRIGTGFDEALAEHMSIAGCAGYFKRGIVQPGAQSLAWRQHRDLDLDQRRQRPRCGETHVAQCPRSALREGSPTVRERGPRGFKLQALRQTRMALDPESLDPWIVRTEGAEVMLMPGLGSVAVYQRVHRMRRRRRGADHVRCFLAPVAFPGERIDRQMHAPGQRSAVKLQPV